MKKELILIILLTCFIVVLGFSNEKPKPASIRTMILSGKIVDGKSNEYLAGVKIVCAHCEKVVYSDLDGRFFIYLEVHSSEKLTLEVSQIGYASQSISVHDLQASSSNLQIDLVSE